MTMIDDAVVYSLFDWAIQQRARSREYFEWLHAQHGGPRFAAADRDALVAYCDDAYLVHLEWELSFDDAVVDCLEAMIAALPVPCASVVEAADEAQLLLRESQSQQTDTATLAHAVVLARATVLDILAAHCRSTQTGGTR
jgi:hypothetical protein